MKVRIVVGEVGRTFDQHQRGTHQRGAEDDQRPDDPAHVGDPQHAVVGPAVEQQPPVEDQLGGEADVRVHHPLGLPGGAGGEHQQVGRLAVHRLGGRVVGPIGAQLVPPVVAARLHRHRPAVVAQHHDVLQRRRGGRGFVDHRLGRHALAAAQARIDGDQRLRLAGDQPRGHRLGPEAGEQRHQHRADLRHGQHGHHRLGQIGHVQRHHVAGDQAECTQGAGQSAHLAVEFGIGDRALRAVLALPDQRGLAPGGRAAPAVEHVEHHVGGAAHAPAGECRPARLVEHGPPGAEEPQAHVPEQHAVEALGVLVAGAHQVVPGVGAERPHEGGGVGRLRQGGVGLPGEGGGIGRRHRGSSSAVRPTSSRGSPSAPTGGPRGVQRDAANSRSRTTCRHIGG